MPVELTDDQETLIHRARSWAEDELAPAAHAREEEGRLPDAVHERAGELGLMGLRVPVEDGGAGLGALAAGLAMGEVAHGDSAVALSIGAHNVLATNHVDHAAEGSIRDRWLPKMAGGEALGAWGLTEPGGGSDVLGMETTVRVEDDELVLDGEKCFITNGSRAEVAVIVAADERGGHSAVLVPADTPGFEGASEHDLTCMQASDTAVIRLREARVARENLLGEPGEGLADAFSCLNLERVVMAAISTASAEHALERAHASLGQAQAKRQATYSPLARLRTQVEASRELWTRAARLLDQGEMESSHAAQAKLFATELAQRVAREAVRLRGHEGLEKEEGLERAVRDGLLGPIGGGTSEMQEIVVARSLGIDADPYRA